MDIISTLQTQLNEVRSYKQRAESAEVALARLTAVVAEHQLTAGPLAKTGVAQRVNDIAECVGKKRIVVDDHGNVYADLPNEGCSLLTEATFKELLERP